MKLVGPMMIFGSAFLLALVLLYIHRAKPWYVHLLSVLLAAAVGLVPRSSMPIPTTWNENAVYLAIGFAFVFLLFWGLAAPFFRGPRGRRAA
ncbi:MAG: hypothetical protein FJW34_21390 [Acidobacteria bacterium]|nr:hypothetical protein [Acidobacteriota bacterium]